MNILILEEFIGVPLFLCTHKLRTTLRQAIYTTFDSLNLSKMREKQLCVAVILRGFFELKGSDIVAVAARCQTETITQKGL